MFSLDRPKQPVIISAKEEAEILGRKMVKENITGIFEYMIVSEKPLIFCFALEKNRFSNLLIQKSRCFAVNFLSSRYEKEFNISFEKRGEHSDKIKLCGFSAEDCDKIDCIRLKEACAFLECEVAKHEDMGDSVVYYGNVLNAVEKNKDKRLII